MIRVDNDEQLLHALRFVEVEPSGQLLDELIGLDEDRTWIELREVWPDPPPGSFAMMVPQTRIFISLPRMRELGLDVGVAALAYSFSQNVPVSTAVALARRVIASIKTLSEGELEVINVLTAAAGGRPYDIGVRLADLSRSFDDGAALVAEVEGLLAKGILRQTLDGSLMLQR